MEETTVQPAEQSTRGLTPEQSTRGLTPEQRQQIVKMIMDYINSNMFIRNLARAFPKSQYWVDAIPIILNGALKDDEAYAKIVESGLFDALSK